MSFTNNVYGGVPQSEMVFSTSNVSSDNASFINLSVSGYATITNLTTVNWSQPNLNASTVVTDTLVVTNTSAVNLDVSGVMNVSDLNISDLNVSDMSVSTLNVGDIVIDEAEVTTLRFDDVTNANYSEIQRDNDTLKIAGGYVNGTGTAFTGDIAFTPYNLSNFTPPSMVVQASDGKVYIPNMSALDINTSTITATSIVNTNQITATGVGLFQSTLAVMNPASQTQNLFWNSLGTTAFQFGNLASVDFNIGNDASNPNKGIIVRGGTNSSVEIPILTADNFSSALSNISTLNVSTIIVDTDIAVPDINTSQLNASNISVDVNLRVFGTTQTDVLEADTITAGCDMTNTLETSSNMYYPNNLLIDYSAPQVATTIELSSNLSLNGIELLPDIVTLAPPTFSMLSGTAQIKNANISTLNVSDLTVDTSISITSLNVSNLSVVQNVSIGGDIVEVGNITSEGNLEFFNISAINEIETDNLIANTATFNGNVNLTTGTMFGNTVGSFANFTSIGGGSILSTVRIEGPLANISIINASDITAEDLHVSGGILTADNAIVSGTITTGTMIGNVSAVEISQSTIRFRDNTQAIKASWFVYPGAMEMYTVNDFRIRNQGIAGSPNFIVFDTSSNNVNISNLSVDNLTCDLTPNLTAGTGITITSVGGKPTISATGGGGGVTDPLNISQLNASNISVDGDIELIGTSNISANATTATVFKVVAENISVSNDITCSNLTRSSALESVANTSVGFDLSVGNITTTNRIRYNPSSLFWQVSASGPQPGGTITQLINFDLALWDKTGGAFGRQGVGFLVNASGWYKCSAHVQFWKVSGTQTQTIRSFFTINGLWQPTRGATFSGTAFMNGNARYGNTSLTNTIFFEAGEEVTVGYQAANQPGGAFGGGIGSVVSAVGSFIYLEFLGGSFNF